MAFSDFPMDEDHKDDYSTDNNSISFTDQDIPGDGTPEKAGGKRKNHHILRWILFVIIIIIAGTVYFRYANPYVAEGHIKGHVVNLEKRGWVFKTYEGELIPIDNHTSTEGIDFSVTDPGTARRLSRCCGDSAAVLVTYKRYWGKLPWRGNSTTVITDMEEAQ